MLRREAANTNFNVCGLTRPGIELTIFCTRSEHANHYTIEVGKCMRDELGAKGDGKNNTYSLDLNHIPEHHLQTYGQKDFLVSICS